MGRENAARDRVITAIRDAIVKGRLLPGEHLVEQEIAKRIGVSRSPVREALAVLRQLGLVDHVRNRGMFVSRLDLHESKEMYAVRGALEGLSCALAALEPQKHDKLPMLRALNQEMAALSDDLGAFKRKNEEFHRAIIDLSQNRLLSQLIEDLWAKSSAFRVSTWFTERAVETAIKEHDQILGAIEAGDAELARKLGSDHATNRFDMLGSIDFPSPFIA